MSGHRFKFIILIFSCSLFAISENMSLHYLKGLDAYHQNQYDLAIQEFETILDNNWCSSELYYNLGNSFYRNSNISGAV